MKRKRFLKILRILAIVIALKAGGTIAIQATTHGGVCYAHSASIPPDPNDGGTCTCGWFQCIFWVC